MCMILQHTSYEKSLISCNADIMHSFLFSKCNFKKLNFPQFKNFHIKQSIKSVDNKIVTYSPIRLIFLYCYMVTWTFYAINHKPSSSSLPVWLKIQHYFSPFDHAPLELSVYGLFTFLSLILSEFLPRFNTRLTFFFLLSYLLQMFVGRFKFYANDWVITRLFA